MRLKLDAEGSLEAALVRVRVTVLCFWCGSGDGFIEPGQLKWLDVQQKPLPEQSASGKPCLGVSRLCC